MSNGNVTNFPRESTIRELVDLQRADLAGKADAAYKDKVAAATTKAEVDDLFVEWWKYQYDPTVYSKADMLERWFGRVLEDSRVHGVTTPRYAKSTSMIGELTDDSAGLVCTPSTEATAGSDPFAHLPQFWCLEVSAEKKQMVRMKFSMSNILTAQKMSDPVNICAGWCRRTPGKENGRMMSINT